MASRSVTESSPSSPPRDSTTALLRAAVLAVVVLIPIRILGHGYRPSDDALRHAAKAVAGRGWSEILVMRPEITIDNHPGWHAILSAVHALTGWNPPALVAFSVVAAFAAFALVPVVLLRRPECFALSLLALAVTEPGVLARLMSGRPFLLTMAATAVICLAWPRLLGTRTRWRTLAVITGLIAAATYVHGSWYLFGLPIAALFGARRFRAGIRLAGATAVGALAGALLTGMPAAFLHQTFLLPSFAMGGENAQGSLALEFRPFGGSALAAVFVLGLVLALKAKGVRRLGRDPAFILLLGGWVLGWLSIRFWSDWGVPAMLVWSARQLGRLGVPARVGAPHRLLAGLTAAAVCFVATTSDVAGRWSAGPDPAYAAMLRPENAAWLPDEGGILYNEEMRMFYELFHARPAARWRYMVGYEPGFMPPEDLAVYRQAVRAKSSAVFAPWIRRMRPQDRMMVRSQNAPPPIPELTWHHLGYGLWSGRLPAPPQ